MGILAMRELKSTMILNTHLSDGRTPKKRTFKPIFSPHFHRPSTGFWFPLPPEFGHQRGRIQ
jgi:hypothetical protein